MKKLVTAALLAVTAAPAMLAPIQAIAQPQADWHDGRPDPRDGHGPYRDDPRDRDRRWAENDWRAWRDRNRALYARGEWRAPFRYARFRPGVPIGPAYFGPRYIIADPWRYHLPRPGLHRAWVRHYDDVLLVDTARGVVVRVLPGFYR